ncbi:MAG: phosphate acyltransferase PlsX [Deltaproteobacteria bacterium]|nr:phosphate acyltransferase PlsX [Deltaproteobacteria bacterium]
MIIAVDAMGGDNAPEVVVHGAVQACEELNCKVILVGDSTAITPHLENGIEREDVTVYNCREVVDMGESPMKAYKKKRDSSIRVAFDLLKSGKADAVVSAGNSGATMVAGILASGKLDGVERPALASILPGESGDVIIIDVGGNVDCRPFHLYQFGVMAEAFAVSCLGIREPKIGILNIGEEPGKGNDLVKSAYDLFKNSPLNFYGNIEGHDILSGKVQIVVCDGFIGNIVLKYSEGLAESIVARFGNGFAEKYKDTCKKGFLKEFKESLDYAQYGGAPILGINGVCIVCHGHSSSLAIKNAIKMAYSYVENNTGKKLLNSLGNCSLT